MDQLGSSFIPRTYSDYCLFFLSSFHSVIFFFQIPLRVMSKFKLDPKTILDLVCFVGASVSVYYLINQVVNSLDGSKSQNKKKANATVQKLQQRHPGLELALDEYEQIIVNSVIMPEDIKVGFKGKYISLEF